MRYHEHLSKDPVLRKIIRTTGPVVVRKRPDTFKYLCRSVLAQQISTTVARILEERLHALIPEDKFNPEAVLRLQADRLRSIGLSRIKTEYLRNIATFYQDLELEDPVLSKLDDESVIELLTQIKGVGRWTVEMLLMFSLGRKDVFPLDDFGIRQAMMTHYPLSGLKGAGLRSAMQQIAMPWAPYRTYAALHLWRMKDR
ncbi:MAG: DNA-3-methyladenine glycosylase family protein [Bacteroidota bacterium]